MCKLFYKFFFVIFQNFQKKNELPWHNALFFLVACTDFALMSMFFSIDALEDFLKGTDLPKGGGKSRFAAMFALISIIVWYTFSFILVHKMKVSKTDGTSPYFSYVPSKRAKIIVYSIIAITLFSPIIIVTLLTNK